MHSREPPRVLVVDDNPVMRTAISSALRRHGCIVQSAADGSEALERLARDRFDAIVSDVDMPVMDGVTLRSEIFARHPDLKQRLLLCSGLPLPPALAADPSVVFLSKPVAAAELWSTVRELLELPHDPPADA